jgi:hypothetical protein
MGLKGPLKNKDGLIEEPGDMIIKVSGFNPILGRQILYFKDPEFSRRSKIKTAEKSDMLINAGANAAPLKKREEAGEEAEKKSNGGSRAQGAAIAAETGNGAPAAPAVPEPPADGVKISDPNELSGEYMDFISKLANPFAGDIEKLRSDGSSFLFFKQEETPSGRSAYDDEKYTGDEPDVPENPAVEMKEDGQDFYSEFVKVDTGYWPEDGDEDDELPIAAAAEAAV